MPSSTIAVLGAGGMLGSDLVTHLRQRGHTVLALDHAACDVTRNGDLAAAVAAAGVLINCAAYTAVDRAESEPERAAALNATAPGRLGELAAVAGCYVVHISTDFVFDGDGTRPWSETDAARPLSVYGATKLLGERRLAESGCRHATVRVQWTYGSHGTHFIDKVLQRARAGGPVKVVDDQIGSPTPTTWLAAVLGQFAERRLVGLYHAAAAGYASRFEVAQATLAFAGIDLPVTACRTAGFPVPARRPLNSRFDCTRLDLALGLSRPDWREALSAFIKGE